MLEGSRFKKESPLEALAYVPAGMLVLYVVVRIFG
jgi:hypothetical protein